MPSQSAPTLPSRLTGKLLVSFILLGFRLAGQTPPAIAALGVPKSAISRDGSFVLTHNGDSLFYNFDAGVIGVPFLRNVYKSFGFSADARHFLYLKANGKFPTFALYSYDVDTSTERQLTDVAVHYAAWAPTGSLLAYLWLDKSNVFHVSTYDLNSGDSTEIGSGQLKSDYLEWSQNAQELLFLDAEGLTSRAVEDGNFRYTLHHRFLRQGTDTTVPAVDWAQFDGNQLIVTSGSASLAQLSIPNPQADAIHRFAVSGGIIYANITQNNGQETVQRWNESSRSFELLAKGSLFLSNSRGVVVRRFTKDGPEYDYVSNSKVQPLASLPGGLTFKIPFQGIASVVQGGSSYTSGACDGVVCQVTSHGGNLGYALDWQQMPEKKEGNTHVLATADGTVAAMANNVTCNTAATTCNIGWDNYSSTCTVANGGAGNYVVIAHLDGSYSFYGHLRSGTPQVVAGQNVLQGAYLADQGHTGVANTQNHYLGCGDHLHFSRQIGPGVWEQGIATDFVETPCLLSCPTAYNSSNIELAPAPTLTSLVPSGWVAGATLQVTLSGRDFIYGSTASVSGTGITVSGVTVFGPARMAMTLTIAPGTAPGPYAVTVTSSNGTSNTIPFQVIGSASGGSLTAAISTPSGTRQLTTLGTSDWAHWGKNSSTSFDHKAGVVQQIGDYATTGSATSLQIVGTQVAYTWSDGTPTTSVSNSTTGVSLAGQNNGFSITAPADLTPRTLTVYVNVSAAQGRMSARLSDGSALDYLDTSLVNGGGTSTAAYAFTYTAASAGQTLEVTFTQNGSSGNVGLQAATLTGAVPTPDFAFTTTPTQSVAPGASGDYTVNVSALSGFTGSVTFGISGLPSGVSAVFNPPTVTGSGTSILTLSAVTGAVLGNYPLILTATSGGLTHASEITLVVVNADFVLSAAPATRNIVVGGMAVQNVTIVPLPGFNGPVSLSVSGLPVGVTGSFNPPTLSGSGVSALTLSASASTFTGNFPFTVTASTTSITHTANVTLSVTAAPTSGALAGSSGAPPAITQLTTEGTLDWAHWGYVNPTDFNHKSGVTQQIGMTLMGGNPVANRFTGNPVGFSWTGGTPTSAATNTTAGLYMLGQDRGYRITVPADTGVRVLRVYVGIFKGQGRMLAQLSDGSAPDYLDTSLNNPTGTSIAVYQFNYNAASSGQTLTLTWTQSDPTIGGNITLEAATLAGPPDFTLAVTPASQTVAAGSNTTYTANVSSLSGFAGTVAFTISGLPTGVTAGFNPTSVPGSGSSTLTLTTTAGMPGGSYPLTVTGTSGTLVHSVPITLNVAASGGTLFGSIANSPATVQLTTEGTTDWTHWGLNAATDFNHKTGVVSQIGNFTSVAGGTAARFTGNPVAYGWTDGTPTVSASNVASGVYLAGLGQGFRIVVPADTAARTLRIYLGVWRAQTRMVAHLSDGSSADYVDTSLTNTSGVVTSGVYTLAYSAASAGQTLTVTFTQTTGGSGNVNLQAATLTGGTVSPDFTVSATPSTQPVITGGAVNYNVSVAAVNGFTGTVGFTVSGLPAGATVGFSPNTVSGSGSSTMTVTTAAGTAASAYSLVITATSGTLTHTANATLNVTDFTTSATPPAQSVIAGSSGGYTVNISSVGGFAENVGFSVTGLPAGATATFSPSTISGSGSSTMTVAIAAGTAATSYPLVINATSGTVTHTANVTLNVTDFSVSGTPASQSIAAGSAATYSVSVSALGGFAGSVGFAVTGLPAGATAGFSPTTVSGSGSSTLTVTTAPGTTALSYQLVITGISGSASRTTNVTLTVTDAPDFSASATPPAQSVAPGGSAPYTVTISALNGFTGTVGFTVSGLPSGAAAVFNPTTVSGSGPSTMTVTTSAGTAAANYPLVITATSGALTHTANVTLAVTDFAVGATPASANVAPGGNVPFTVTVSALNGFTGTVGFTVSGLPSGATAVFNPTTVSGSGPSTMTVTTAAGTAPASYPLVITATSGALTHTANVTLTVAAAPDFSVGATPPSASTSPGGGVPYTVTVSALNGFTGTVGFSVSGLPSGATAVFNPTTVSGSGPSTMTVTTAAGTAAANYPLVITATSGALTHTANVTLAVTDFAVGATPASANVVPGGNVPFTVTVSALNGFTGTVGFSVNGLPSGATAVFNPTTVSGSGPSTMTVTTAAGTAPASYPLVITGTSGGLTHTANVTLTVTAAPDFAVGASPSSASTSPGGNAPYTVTVSALNGFTGTVGFTVSGVPSGASAGFNPTTVTGSGSSIMTVTTTGATTTGSYPLTITATSGALSHTTNVTLNVTPGGGGALSGTVVNSPGSVTLTTEGTTDWAHWGLNTATDFNHKAAVVSQIGNFSSVGGATAGRFTANPVIYSWTDGTPTSSASSVASGVYVSGQNQGFRIVVPAETTVRTLRVYIGLWRAQSKMVAHLSDGSSADYVDTSLTNTAGPVTSGVYTLTYSAASSGQTLTVTFTQTNATSGNVNLQAATLSGGTVVPDFTLAATPSTRSVGAGSGTTYTVTASALSGFSGSVGLTVSGTPPGATVGFSPASISGSGTSTLTVTTAAGTTAGNYGLTITGTSGALTHTANVTLTVTGVGSLAGAVTNSPGSVSLTAEGSADWAHWGLNAATDFNHKVSITSQIGNFSSVAGGTAARFTGNPVIYSWTDGTPTTSASNVASGVYLSGVNQGFRVVVPADTTVRTLRIYVGVWRAQSKMVAHLSDGSAVDYIDTSLVNTAGAVTSAYYTLTYRAASSGQTLTVTFTQTNATTGNVNLQAATLQ